MGLAEQALGQWSLAEQHLHEALAANGDAWVSTRRTILMNATTVVAHHLGNILVTGPSSGGAHVLLDGIDVGPLPLLSPVRMETGSHLLEVRAAGFYPVIRENVNLMPSSLPEGGTALPLPAAPTEKVYVNEGNRVPGAFHASFLPGGPAIGMWVLRDPQDSALCTLPCTYWIDPSQKYSLTRSMAVASGPDVRLAVPALLFGEGAEVREQIKGPSGSFIGGIALTVGAAALLVIGVVVLETAPPVLVSEDQMLAGQSDSPSSVYLDELGVIAIIVGGLGTAGGIAMTVLSEPWRVDARTTGNAPAASLKLTKKGVELAAGSTHAWLTPGGIQGVF
jgi:hypothetical protein